MPDDPSAGDAPHGIDIDDALVIMERLAKAHHEESGRGIACMVAFGGTALAAHGVRRKSDDLDIYVTDLSEAAIERVTTQWRQERPKAGGTFKIDATPERRASAKRPKRQVVDVASRIGNCFQMEAVVGYLFPCSTSTIL